MSGTTIEQPTETNNAASGLRAQSKGIAAVRKLVLWKRHFGITSSDIFLASYPKSGNTWLKFMLCHLLSGHEVDFDESERICPGIGAQNDAPKVLPNSGRLIKTHEAMRPEYKKAIYIVRDGRDVAVSYYFHLMREGKVNGPFSEALPLILSGAQDGYGTWQDHIASWLDSAANKAGNLCVIRYEDCLSEPKATLDKVVAFLHAPVNDQQIEEAIAANTADKMRAKEKSSQSAIKHKHKDIPFVRAATKGGWRAEFTDKDIALFNAHAGEALSRLGYTES